MVSFPDGDRLDVFFHRVREEVSRCGDALFLGGRGDHESLTRRVSNERAPPHQPGFRVIPRIGRELGFEVFDGSFHGMWSGNTDVSCPKLASMHARRAL